MASKQAKRMSPGSTNRQKFIIPPMEKSLFNTANDNFKSSAFNPSSIKRNLLFTSTKQKSQSQKKIVSDHLLQRKSDQVKPLDIKKVNRGASCYHKEECNKSIVKFRSLNTEVDPGVSWQKWKKQNINMAGQTFIINLNNKIQKKAISFEIQEKENKEFFHLKHKFRELNTLKQTIRIAKQNNDLIKKLEKESNDKIRCFFGKHQKIVQELK